MKEYYRKKALERNILGQDIFAFQTQAQADTFSDQLSVRLSVVQKGLGLRYRGLNPPQTTIGNKSHSEVTLLDLISEGPVEGFVNTFGLSTNDPMEATYFDNTVVKTFDEEPQFEVTSINNSRNFLVDAIKPVSYSETRPVNQNFDDLNLTAGDSFILTSNLYSSLNGKYVLTNEGNWQLESTIGLPLTDRIAFYRIQRTVEDAAGNSVQRLVWVMDTDIGVGNEYTKSTVAFPWQIPNTAFYLPTAFNPDFVYTQIIRRSEQAGERLIDEGQKGFGDVIYSYNLPQSGALVKLFNTKMGKLSHCRRTNTIKPFHVGGAYASSVKINAQHASYIKNYMNNTSRAYTTHTSTFQRGMLNFVGTDAEIEEQIIDIEPSITLTNADLKGDSFVTGSTGYKDFMISGINDTINIITGFYRPKIQIAGTADALPVNSTATQGYGPRLAHWFEYGQDLNIVAAASAYYKEGGYTYTPYILETEDWKKNVVDKNNIKFLLSSMAGYNVYTHQVGVNYYVNARTQYIPRDIPTAFRGTNSADLDTVKTLGYKSPVYLMLSIYSQDSFYNQSNTWQGFANGLKANTKNTLDGNTPRKYRGNIIHGLGIGNSFGTLTSVWTSRSTLFRTFGPAEQLAPQYEYNQYINVYENCLPYLKATSSETTFAEQYPGHVNPLKVVHSFVAGSNVPAGIREPFIKKLENLKSIITGKSYQENIKDEALNDMGYLIFRGDLFNFDSTVDVTSSEGFTPQSVIYNNLTDSDGNVTAYTTPPDLQYKNTPRSRLYLKSKPLLTLTDEAVIPPAYLNLDSPNFRTPNPGITFDPMTGHNFNFVLPSLKPIIKFDDYADSEISREYLSYYPFYGNRLRVNGDARTDADYYRSSFLRKRGEFFTFTQTRNANSYTFQATEPTDTIPYEVQLALAAITRNPYYISTETSNSVDYNYNLRNISQTSQPHGVQIYDMDSNRYVGSFAYPIYLGPNGEARKPNGEVDMDKVLVQANDPDKNIKILQGVNGNYDVIVTDSFGFKYGNAANPYASHTPAVMNGKYINVSRKTSLRAKYNFDNLSIKYRDGSETQLPLESEVLNSVSISTLLLGPVGTNEQIRTDLQQTGILSGTLSVGAYQGNQSKHFIDGVDFTNQENQRAGADGNIVKHIIHNPYVSKIQVCFLINALNRNVAEELNPFQFRAVETSESLAVRIEIGFENVNYTPIIQDKTYVGRVTDGYSVDTAPYDLPKYNEIVNQFPDLTKQQVIEKCPRYVKVKKLSYETDSPFIQKSIRVSHMNEIVEEKFTYPNSSIIKIRFDSRNYSSIPVRTYTMRLKKVLVPSNYFPLLDNGKDKRFLTNTEKTTVGLQNIYNGDWDGTFKQGWTDNPAWIIYDLLINKVYGIGNRLDSVEDIDVFNLYKIAKYCDAVDNNGNFVGVPDGENGLEPRFSCNVLFNSSQNPYNMINDVASVFNGKCYWDGEAVNFYCDKPEPVAAFFNNENVEDGLFNYEDTANVSHFNLIKVEYKDKKDKFMYKIASVSDEEALRLNGPISTTISAPGATSRGQALRKAKYVMLSNKLETEIVNFATGPEALTMGIGDVIQINDEIKEFEPAFAQVIEIVNDTNFRISKDFDLTKWSTSNPLFVYNTNQTDKGLKETVESIKFGESNFGQVAESQYKVNIGDEVPVLIITDQGDHYLVTHSATFNAKDLHVGSYVGTNLNDSEPLKYRVLSIEPKESNLYAIRATEYRQEKYNLIETQDGDNFGFEDTTKKNIGEPSHVVKTATEPDSFTTNLVQNSAGIRDLEVDIVGSLSGTETHYIVQLISKSPISVREKKVLKGSISNSKYRSSFTFRNIESYGDYEVTVKSIIE